ncbi:MAG: carboxypeptidase-like regulatory domain-containing protein [Acidobacteriia bacterium]|nr:carboxypeptidase-like regulatory domain-containing protein [Terriglobia bacterium]
MRNGVTTNAQSRQSGRERNCTTRLARAYAEAGYGTGTSFTPTPVGQKPLSLLVGPTWETEKFSLRANYVRQSTTYMPLLGYFVGDRKGPFVEGHYRPAKWVDFYGSASGYSNNLEGNPELPTFHSTGKTAGASFVLPWKFNASTSLSEIRFTVRDPSRPGESISDNRQMNVNLFRPIKRHSLRFSLIDMKLNTNIQPQTQRFEEFEDRFTWKHLVLGGAIRVQSQHAAENKNTLFFRGSLQANFKRVSAYGYIEKGNDLVNKSIFSTNSYSSTVAGLSAPLFRGWNLQFEAFRNKLLTDLNPENVFLFGSGALGLNTQLAAFNQWSVFFRVSKQFRWGRELRGGTSLEDYAAEHAPLVGSVQGLVMEQTLAGARPASNVAISLDHYRTALTDGSGRYQFSDVPEGPHEVGLDMEQLPADYDAGPAAEARVSVEPRALLRADFNVVRLTSLVGRIVAPAGAPVENVLVRLAGTSRYTTPDPDGTFAFYNLREGEYDPAIDEKTLPEGYLLVSPASVHVLASSSKPATPVIFELKEKPREEKPIRQILHQEIHVGGASGGGGGGGSHGGSHGGSDPGRGRGGAGGKAATRDRRGQ